MDFRVISDNYRYGVRVTAIIIKEDKLLTYKVNDQYHLVGGAIEVGEASRAAVLREVREELGIEGIASDLMFIVENRFDYCGELHHMVEFHYKVELLGDVPLTTVDENQFECEWIPLDALPNYDLRPSFLKEKLKKWEGHVQHIDISIETT